MQVRTLSGFILPPTPARVIAPVAAQNASSQPAPVAAQDERSQPVAPALRSRKIDNNDLAILTRQNQRYSYAQINADGSKTSQALQTYFDIQTQDEQERSQSLLGIDVHA